MNVAVMFDSAVCRILALTLLHFVWQGAVIAGLSLVVLACLKRRTAQSRYLACCLSLLLMTACLPVTFSLLACRDSGAAAGSTTRNGNAAYHSAMAVDEISMLERLRRTYSSNTGDRPAERAQDRVTEVDASAFANVDSRRAGENLVPGVANSPPATDDMESPTWNKLAGIVCIAYLLGFLTMSARLFLAMYGGQRLRNGCAALDDPELVSLIREATCRLGMRRVPLIGIAGRICSPAVIGLLRPIVVLPAAVVTGLNSEQLRAVMLHELAHLRRYDHVMLMLQRAVETLLFFHPAVWIISHRTRIERERCCDDDVLAAGTQRLAYVESLLRVAELRLLERGVAPQAALSAVDDPSQLRRRIARLLGEPIEPALRLTRTGMLAAIVLVGITVLLPALVQSGVRQSAARAENVRPASSPEEPPSGRQPAKKHPSNAVQTANDDAANVGRRGSRLTISKETTFVTGPLTDDGLVDYRAAINEHFSKGVTAENNAVVALMMAIGPRPENAELPDEFFELLGIERLPDKGEYFAGLHEYTQQLAENSNPPQDFETLWIKVEKQWERTLAAPWHAKDFPVINDWLQQNEKPLAIAVLGTQRPRYYHPWVAKGDDPLFAQLLPMVQVQREFARKLSIRANRRIAEGDLDGAWEDHMAMHRLARLLGEGPTLIELLVGFAVDSVACQDDLFLAQHEKLTAEQAARMQKELAALPAIGSTVECVNFGERLSFLDIAQQLTRHPGKEIETLQEIFGELSGDSDGLPEKQVAALKKLTQTTPIRWDDVMRNANGWFDRLVVAARKPGYQERKAAAAEVFADVEQSSKVWADLPEIANTFPMGIKNPNQWVTEQVANGLAVLLLPAVQACLHAETRSANRVKATRLAFALAAYRQDRGQYPAKLEELAPQYIDAIPKDPLGKEIKFSSDGRGYVLTIADPEKILDIVVSTADRREE